MKTLKLFGLAIILVTSSMSFAKVVPTETEISFTKDKLSKLFVDSPYQLMPGSINLETEKIANVSGQAMRVFGLEADFYQVKFLVNDKGGTVYKGTIYLRTSNVISNKVNNTAEILPSSAAEKPIQMVLARCIDGDDCYQQELSIDDFKLFNIRRAGFAIFARKLF